VALNLSHVGYTYPPAEAYLVSREKVREFAAAIGADEPYYRDPAEARKLGYPDLVAPPTFPAVVTGAATDQLREDEGLGLDFSRVVHGDQKISYTRPIHAGDRLVSRCTIEDITSRAGHEFLTFRIDIADEAGAPVASVSTRFVVRGDHESG
jgi:acyl dehydratase